MRIDRAGRISVNVWIDPSDWEALELIGRKSDTGRAAKSEMVRLAVRKYVQSILDSRLEIREFVEAHRKVQPLSLIKVRK